MSIQIFYIQGLQLNFRLNFGTNLIFLSERRESFSFEYLYIPPVLLHETDVKYDIGMRN